MGDELSARALLSRNREGDGRMQLEGAAKQPNQTVCKPGSVMAVSRDRQPRRSFLWDVHCWTPRATDPGCGQKTAHLHPLFGLAPGGVYHAGPVARPAVGSYPTLSPLPAPKCRRFALCGTFPRLAPGGRYPPPCLPGARTFLQRFWHRQRPPDRLVGEWL